MWNEAANLSYSSSYLMKNYPEAAKWLMQNMDDNELAIVPMLGVFETLQPDLKGKLVHYSDAWKGAGVHLKADNTLAEILLVRSYLLDYMKQEKIRYLLVSATDPYNTRLFEKQIQDELALFEVNEFHSSGSLWNDPVTIYTYARARREIFKLAFTNDTKYNTRGNAEVFIDTSGLVIFYTGDSSVYIPIFLNSSLVEKLLLTVHAAEMSEGVRGNIVLYLDVDGDGKWGGWEVDTGMLIPIPGVSGKTEILFSQEFYKIAYDIIQVGIALYGDTSQTITIKTITFYEAYEPGT